MRTDSSTKALGGHAGLVNSPAEMSELALNRVDLNYIHSNRFIASSRTLSKDLHYCTIHLLILVRGAMVVNLESLFLAWYLPQPGSNGSETFVYCAFLCSAILIDVRRTLVWIGWRTGRSPRRYCKIGPKDVHCIDLSLVIKHWNLAPPFPRSLFLTSY